MAKDPGCGMEVEEVNASVTAKYQEMKITEGISC